LGSSQTGKKKEGLGEEGEVPARPEYGKTPFIYDRKGARRDHRENERKNSQDVSRGRKRKDRLDLPPTIFRGIGGGNIRTNRGPNKKKTKEEKRTPKSAYGRRTEEV